MIQQAIQIAQSTTPSTLGDSSMDYANYNISKDISNQPEDARSMALLANVLIEKVKRASHSDHHQHHELKEALSLANTSIKLSPTESIGYAVLSTITLLKFEQRMIYLRKAVDIEQQTVKRSPTIYHLV